MKKLFTLLLVISIQQSFAQCPSASGTIPDSDACVNDGPVTIADPLDGNTSCTLNGNPMPGRTFDPAAVGVGVHELICTNTTQIPFCTLKDTAIVTVNAIPIVVMNTASQSVLVTDASFSLSASPSGGIFSGNGVSASDFDPAVAGVGVSKVKYAFTDGNGCTSEDSVDITVNAAVGVYENDVEFSVFPNPTVSNIELSFANSADRQIEILNLSGKVVRNIVSLSDRVLIDMNDMSQGLYFVRVISEGKAEVVQVSKL